MVERLRVLVASNMYPGPHGPYYGAFVARQVELLRRDERLEVRVRAISDPRKGRALLKYGGFGAGLAADLVRFRPHVVHYHYALPTALLAPLHARVPYVVTLHGGDVYEMPARVPGGDRLLAAILRRAARVVAVGRELAREVEARVPALAGRVLVLNMGVERRFLEHATATERRPSRLAYVGQLIERKGVDLLLEALARATVRAAGARLTIIGDGPARARLEGEARRLGIADLVHFAGAVAPERVPEALEGHGTLVVPSRREPLGIVALEGMALGMVVVAARVGGLAELVADGDNGLLAAPGDAGALAAVLDRALAMAPGERARMTAAGRRAAALQSVERQTAVLAAELVELARIDSPSGP